MFPRRFLLSYIFLWAIFIPTNSVCGQSSWERVSTNLFDKNFEILTADPDGKVIFLASDKNLYRTLDGGSQWENIFGLRGNGRLNFVQPDGTKRLFLLSTEGVFKSGDGGKNWKTVSGLNPDAHRVLVPPSNPGKVYLVMPTTNCGPTDIAGVCVSQDGGENWVSLTPRDFRIGYVDPLLVHPHNGSLIFTAGAKTGPGTWRKTRTADARIARSRDGGKSWEVLNDGLPEHISASIEAVSMDVWNGGYALFGGTTDGDIFYSADEGNSWRRIIQGIGPVSKAHHYHNLQASAA